MEKKTPKDYGRWDYFGVAPVGSKKAKAAMRIAGVKTAKDKKKGGKKNG